MDVTSEPAPKNGRPGRTPDVSAPWAKTPAGVLAALGTSSERGLSAGEVRARLRVYGPNRLRQIRRRSAWQILLDQFLSLIVGLLVAAAAVAFALGELVEGLAIVAVIFINAGIGFVTEMRAVRSMEALRELGGRDATVRREGVVRSVSATELVPGSRRAHPMPEEAEAVVISAGDRVGNESEATVLRLAR